MCPDFLRCGIARVDPLAHFEAEDETFVDKACQNMRMFMPYWKKRGKMKVPINEMTSVLSVQQTSKCATPHRRRRP